MNAKTRKLSLETLEARQLMAGDAFAFDQGDTLFIVENDVGAAQDIKVINHGNGAVEVVGQDGTQIFGQQSFFNINNLNIQLGDGSDNVEIVGTDGQFQSITVNVADGNKRPAGSDDDTVELTNIDTNGNVIINTGRGTDEVTIENEFYSPYVGTPRTIRGLLDIETGAGADMVNLTNVAVNGDIDIRTYDSLNEVDVDEVHIDGGRAYDLIARLGGGSDTFDARNTDISGLTHVNTDRGADTVNLRWSYLNEVEVFSGSGGDTVRLNGNTRLVRADIFTGNGHDTVEVMDNVDPGPGTATMDLLNIETGRGRDTVHIMNNEQIDRLFADLGRGDDTMVLENNTVNPAYVSGGGDNDTIYKKNNRYTGIQGFTQWEDIINNY